MTDGKRGRLVSVTSRLGEELEDLGKKVSLVPFLRGQVNKPHI